MDPLSKVIIFIYFSNLYKGSVKKILNNGFNYFYKNNKKIKYI